MTAPIEDVSSLPGRKVSDQEEVPVGEVKEIYAIGGDGYPMWVSVEGKFGSEKRTVFIPLARLKEEDGELRVPYSKDHLGQAPEVDGSDGISVECDRQLRDHYGIDRGDQELRADNKSYATLVPDEPGASERVEDVDQLETPDADQRTDETHDRLHDPGSAEIRHVDAGEIADENAKDSRGRSDGDAEAKRGSDSESETKSDGESETKSDGGSETKRDGGRDGGREAGSEAKSEPEGRPEDKADAEEKTEHSPAA